MNLKSTSTRKILREPPAVHSESRSLRRTKSTQSAAPQDNNYDPVNHSSYLDTSKNGGIRFPTADNRAKQASRRETDAVRALEMARQLRRQASSDAAESKDKQQ